MEPEMEHNKRHKTNPRELEKKEKEDVSSFEILKDQMETLQHTLTKTMRSIEADKEELMAMERAWNDLREKVKQDVERQKDVIKFNVGGTTIETTKETLQRVPDTYFTAMLSELHRYQSQDGYYFIDRDPEMFKIIISYLRRGRIDTQGLSREEIRKLNEELDYFSIGKRVDNCSLLSEEHEDFIFDKCVGGGEKLGPLLYRGSTDGLTFKAMRDRCRGKRFLLYIIRPKYSTELLALYSSYETGQDCMLAFILCGKNEFPLTILECRDGEAARWHETENYLGEVRFYDDRNGWLCLDVRDLEETFLLPDGVAGVDHVFSKMNDPVESIEVYTLQERNIEHATKVSIPSVVRVSTYMDASLLTAKEFTGYMID
ncbi:K+ channel tetramerization domain-containing protein [Planoprotostelium fungivorum]|uniref:K+ channel tetramerization domain-containing protein n=1 Tax=Planoprotostelium fungivorum TaxID=1890364 RepID=A0A2P6N5U5_9EUKA|nr:K+ channel tetramerization domain-containing protein [Planoprotostelium fungivorum]